MQDKNGNDLVDTDGNKIRNREYEEYIRLWGIPQLDKKDNVINKSAPKILVKDSDGKFNLIDNQFLNEPFNVGGKKYHENIY